MTDTRAPRVKLTTLWERESREGTRYFSGFIGNCKILLFRDDRAPVPEGAVAVWSVLLEEAPPKQRPAAEPKGPSPPPSQPRQPAHGQGGQRISFRQKRAAEPQATTERPFDDPVPF